VNYVVKRFHGLPKHLILRNKGSSYLVLAIVYWFLDLLSYITQFCWYVIYSLFFKRCEVASLCFVLIIGCIPASLQSNRGRLCYQVALLNADHISRSDSSLVVMLIRMAWLPFCYSISSLLFVSSPLVLANNSIYPCPYATQTLHKFGNV
jgi:hypothetical protein